MSGDTRRRQYRLTPQPLGGAVEWMADVGAEWDERLDALRRHVERDLIPRTSCITA